MTKRLLIFIIISSCIATGCYYDKEEELYPNSTGSNCDTANVTYSVTVNTLLQNYGCLGCHIGSAPSGNVNLQGHAAVRTAALTTGRLFGSINHSPGFHPMPQGGNKMNNCDIAKVKAWIDAGAPNN